MMLPKAVLSVPKRKGNYHRKLMESTIKNHCNRRLLGERMSLWNDNQEIVRKSNSIDHNKEAIKLCMDGQLSKACK